MTSQRDTNELAPCEQVLDAFVQKIHDKLIAQGLHGHMVMDFDQTTLFEIIIAEMKRIAIETVDSNPGYRGLGHALRDAFTKADYEIHRALDNKQNR